MKHTNLDAKLLSLIERIAKSETMKAEFGKYGPKHDYREAHVALEYCGRLLLGTIKEVYRNQVGATHCKVFRFNGEPWPFDPALSALEILERDEPTDCCAELAKWINEEILPAVERLPKED